MKLSDDLIKRLESITMTDYNFTDTGETDRWDIIVEDLIREFEDLQDEFENYKAKQIDRFEDGYWGDD